MAAIFISGFSGTSSGAVPGAAAMAASPTVGAMAPGGSTALTWWDHQLAVTTISAALAANPCQPIIVVGHSLGGDTAIEVCDLLAAVGICVDLLIQIESVGAYDDVVPANVKSALNLYAAGLTVPKGETAVLGATNVAIGGTDHTTIDDDPVANPTGVGAATTPGPYLGMNAWQIVAAAIAGLPAAPWCNCRCPAAAGGGTLIGSPPTPPTPPSPTPAPHHFAPHHDPTTQKIRVAIVRLLEINHSNALPFTKLSNALGIAVEKLVGPMRTLLADGTIHEVPGKTEEPWLAFGPPKPETPPTCQKP